MAFADDTVFLQNEINKCLHYQERVKYVVGWLNNKSMTINCKKTVEVSFSKSKRSNQATNPPTRE